MNQKIKLSLLIFFLFMGLNVFNTSANEKIHRIEILVNDKIITNYDILQRLRIFSILNRVTIDESNHNSIYNKIVNDLIDEKLQKEKMIEYKIFLNSEEKEYYEENYLIHYNLTKEKAFNTMIQNNIDVSILREMIYTQIGWDKLTSGLFFRTIAISDIEIDELLKSNPSLKKEEAENIIKSKQLKLKSNKFLRDIRSEATIEQR
tara:strand:+ start:2945 stop:3559 length:615 start_codon:yes stop_codon:yes gene_type:complete